MCVGSWLQGSTVQRALREEDSSSSTDPAPACGITRHPPSVQTCTADCGNLKHPICEQAGQACGRLALLRSIEPIWSPCVKMARTISFRCRRPLLPRLQELAAMALHCQAAQDPATTPHTPCKRLGAQENQHPPRLAPAGPRLPSLPPGPGKSPARDRQVTASRTRPRQGAPFHTPHHPSHFASQVLPVSSLRCREGREPQPARPHFGLPPGIAKPGGSPKPITQ